jgi:hypothetical protein
MENKFRIIIEGSYRSTEKKPYAIKVLEHIEHTVRAILIHNENLLTANLTHEDPQDTIHNSWCTEDILSRAKERHIRISKKVARRLLAEMNHKFDASQGINWDVIDCYIDSRND